jgi:hypothetical protein
MSVSSHGSKKKEREVRKRMSVCERKEERSSKK